MNAKRQQLQQLIRPDVQRMEAYKVANASGLVKLDAMENPYPWPKQMKTEWLKLMAEADINRYPDPSSALLIKKLRKTFDIGDDQAVLLGNGSDELIQLVLMALNPSSCVLVPTPSFVMYQQISTSLGLPCECVPLNADFSLNMPMMLEAIKKHDPAVIFLAYPNNPTANLFDENDIIKIVEACNGLIIIDEAYQPFAGKTFLQKLTKNMPQLLVMRTVSKLGLAGLRLGYLVGDKALLEQFEKIRLPYNINVLTQLTATFAFDHIKELDKQAESICKQRESLLRALGDVENITVFPSQANFILFSLLDKSAKNVFSKLKKAGILIKLMGNVEGLPTECLRVTVGTQEQNKQFLNALTSIYNES
ncbi:MAG: histidinol-phosphate transaminase [Piscirickettsiaceae bacterium]|nr:MAG: histidinol-phosphate transaminase [Piscirickettsiaceae bacterium]